MHQRTQQHSDQQKSKKTLIIPKKIQNFSIWKVLSKLKLKSLATLGPVGFFPKGSGTVGSLVALPLAYCLGQIFMPLLWIATIALYFLGIAAIDQYTKNKEEKDPRCVIIDEVVGQMTTFCIVIPGFLHWPILLLGFLLFRLFDVVKFGSVAMWDQQKRPLGVMMDDVMAGLQSAFILGLIQIIYILT